MTSVRPQWAQRASMWLHRLSLTYSRATEVPWVGWYAGPQPSHVNISSTSWAPALGGCPTIIGRPQGARTHSGEPGDQVRPSALPTAGRWPRVLDPDGSPRAPGR